MPTTYAIPNGRTVMDATTYTGTGANRSITNQYGFKPDLVWVKRRDTTANHVLTDSNRGANKQLLSSSTNAESSDTDLITGFNSNGFSLGVSAGYDVNVNNGTYVGWQWQAGQGTTSSNTNGSITSTVSVNASAGFSIVTYTGNGSNNQTVGHSLGVAPSMIIIKNRSATQGWAIWHGSLPTKAGYLNDTSDFQTNSYPAYGFNEPNSSGTYPTSSVFYISASGRTYNSAITNGSGNTFVAYCWAEIAGFSKFGSYTGNGSTDGPFIYTGFRPKFVMLKQYSGSGDNWHMMDTSRDTYNAAGLLLNANLSDATNDARPVIDILSNGFKLRNTYGSINGNGSSYLYACFAENPFKYANAR